MTTLTAVLSEVNRRIGIGLLTVLTAFLAVLVSTWGMVYHGWPEWIQSVVLAGFIGGFTDTVAIHMLFTRVRFLPGSGVLLTQRDKIIASLADTMERHILNPQLIERKVQDLAANLDRARLLATANLVVDEVRPDLIAFINAPEQRAQITAAIRREGGFWGDMAHAIGVVTYDTVADRICQGLTRQMLAFRIDEPMLDRALASVGSLDDFLLKPGNPLVRKHYGSEQSLVQLVFTKLDAKELVVERLSAYDATQIRDIIADNIRDHMAWLQLFGVVLGMMIAGVIEIINVLVHR